MTLERTLQKAAGDASALVDAWKLNPHPRIAAVISQLPDCYETLNSTVQIIP